MANSNISESTESKVYAAGSTAAPDRTQAPPISDIEHLEFPEIREDKLSGSIVAKVIDSGSEPVCRIYIAWPLGTADVAEPEALMIAVNQLSEGSAEYSGAEINGILEENGAWLKNGVGPHSTFVSLYALNSTLPQVLPVLRSIIAHPVFPRESALSHINKMASAKEIASCKPAFQATALANEAFFGEGHPRARTVTAESLRAVGLADLPRMFDFVTNSSTPTVYISGNIPQEIIGQLKESFHDIRQGSGKSQNILSPRPLGQEMKAVRQMPGSLQTGIRIVYPAPCRTAPDFEALRMAVIALGGYFGSRLMSNIREDKGYTYGISAALAPAPDGDSIIISCETDNRYVPEVLKEIDREIARITTEEIPADELATVRNVIISQLADILDSPFSSSAYIEYLEGNGWPVSLYANQFSSVKSLTSKEIREAAHRYLADVPRVVAMAGDAENGTICPVN